MLSTLRRRLDDKDSEVRQTAFLVSLLSRPNLAKAIRERDKNLHRLLFDIEHFSIHLDTQVDSKIKTPPKTRKSKLSLEPADYSPLLQATASLSLDSCLLGAHCLALLNDPRAFGLLLQLSREENNSARVKVCQALANLNDQRADQRLQTLLNDSAIEVRDAAFTALSTLYASSDEPLVLHGNDKQPLKAVQLGLTSHYADVRRRALQTLVRIAKKDSASKVPTAAREKVPTAIREKQYELFHLAINDGTPNVRSEAFKAVLNLPVGSSHEAALRFSLQSTHADIRREVQTELIAEASHSWAWSLLLELLNDPDRTIRDETLAFALKKTKGRDYAPLAVALKSAYRDTRLSAVKELNKKPGEQSQQLLVEATDDSDREVRKQVIQALVDAQAETALKQAMTSEYQDVVLQAANACARLGDESVLKPLLELVTQAKPDNADDAKRWKATIESALVGLSLLQSPACVSAVAPLLESDASSIRRAAAQTLLWCCDASQQAVLNKALQHQDSQVKHAAALGLALLGKELGKEQSNGLAMQLALEQSQTQADKLLCIGALLGFEDTFADRLSFYLDDDEHLVRVTALITHLLLSYQKLKGVLQGGLQKSSNIKSAAAPLLTILSAKAPMFRLIAAQAIERLNSQEAFAELLGEIFSSQSSKQSSSERWKVPAEDIELFAKLVIFGSPRLRCKTLPLLEYLFADKQDAWDQAWRSHTYRYQTEIDALTTPDIKQSGTKQPSTKQKPTKIATNLDEQDLIELEQIAFGTYCGLVREQGGISGRHKVQHADSSIISVRRSALGLLAALYKRNEGCKKNDSFLGAAESVFMQALGDPNQAVRIQALEQLQTLTTDTALLANECLETEHNDLGVKALEMLTEGESQKQGQAILQQAMVSRSDNLALEAAKLLLKKSKPVTVAKAALDAVDSTVRLRAIDWLIEDYDNSKAQALLHKALTSRHKEVRENCTYALAVKKDPKAFDALITLLDGLLINNASAKGVGREQNRAIQSLVTLGDPRGADALVDLIEKLAPLGKSVTEQFNALFNAIGGFRITAVAARLLVMMDNTLWRQGAFQALLTISGYDQPIEDPEDEKVDRSWLEQQHPRHDALLQQLLDRCLELGEVNQILALLEAARWSPSDAVNVTLTTLAHHANDDIRQISVYALGWRIRKRNGPSSPVTNALSHQDPITQFWAAYCLAKAGHGQGMNILLAAVESLAELKLRQYAVQALGELGDERALDTLLRLAKDDEHALQESAAEAIGHLGPSEQAEAIFELLKRFVTSDRWGLVINALHGLRYFDTRAGWQLVREKAADPHFFGRETALEMLGFHDDPTSKDLLLAVLAEEDASYYRWGKEALNSARRLFGGDSLAPDYAFLRCGVEPYDDDNDFSQSLQRVSKTGDAHEIFRILPDCANEVRTQLTLSLLNRTSLPVNEAVAALTSPHPEAVEVAATLVGYSKPTNKESVKAIENTLSAWAEKWAEMRELTLRGVRNNDADDSESLSITLMRLIWAAGVASCSTEILLGLANAHQDDTAFNDIRFAAFTALSTLSSVKPNAAIIELMTQAISHTDSRTRALAANVVANSTSKQSPIVKVLKTTVLKNKAPKSKVLEGLAEQTASDRAIYQQLTRHFDAKSLNESGLSNAHLQGVVLPQVISNQSIEALSTTALNGNLAESTRQGAIEALAQVASTEGEAALIHVASTEVVDEDLRKMAWRCLQRSKRARIKAQASFTVRKVRESTQS